MQSGLPPPQLGRPRAVNWRGPCANVAHRRARRRRPRARRRARARRPSGVKLVGCESALDPAGRAATFEGADAGAARARARCRCASRCRRARAERAALAHAAGRRLRQVADQRPGRRPLRLHEARRRAGGARLLPHDRALPLARRRRRPRRVVAVDLGGLPPVRPAAEPAPARRRGAGRRRRRHARYLVPVVNRGRSLAGPFDVVVRSTARRSRRRRRPSSRPASARSSRSRARRARTGRC